MNSVNGIAMNCLTAYANEPPEDDDHYFYGHLCDLGSLENEQRIRALCKDKQLRNSLYPGLERAFRAHSFDKVDWFDLLWKEVRFN